MAATRETVFHTWATGADGPQHTVWRHPPVSTYGRTAELVVPRSMPTTFSARTTSREDALDLVPHRLVGAATRLPWKPDRTPPSAWEVDMVERRGVRAGTGDQECWSRAT